MATSPRPKAAGNKTAADTSAAVVQFMAALQHPQKAAIEALRTILCTADPSIAEGVKWNAPSFRTTEYFATTHLRMKAGVGVIFHLGAKVREHASVRIDDPEGLLTWIAKDRAVVAFSGIDDVIGRGAALQDVVRQWIRHV